MSYQRNLFLSIFLAITTTVISLSVPPTISLFQPHNLTIGIGINPLTGNTPSRPIGGFTGQFWVEAITQGTRSARALAPTAKIWAIISSADTEITDPSDLTDFEIKFYDPKRNQGQRYLDIEGEIRTKEDRENGRVTWDPPRIVIGPADPPKGYIKWPPPHDIFEVAVVASDLGYRTFDKVTCVNLGSSTVYYFSSHSLDQSCAIDAQSLREVEI